MNGRTLFRALFWLALALATAVFVGKALFPGADLYEKTLTPAILLRIGSLSKLFFAALAVAAAMGIVRRFETGNPSRPAWILLTGGLAGLLLGQSILAYFQLVQGRALVFPSVADAAFILGSFSVVAALIAFLRVYEASGFPTGGPRERWTFGLISALLCAAVVGPTLLPVVRTPAPALEKLLNLAYPMLDVLMLIPALLLLRVSLRFRGGKIWAVWGALLAGILFTAAGDILFAYLSTLGRTQLEDLVDAMYILSFGCFAAGVLRQRELLVG